MAFTKGMIEKLRGNDIKNNAGWLAVFLYFFFYFIIGICIYKDYGFSVDEAMQWEKSVVAYKYINNRMFHREIPELINVKSLEEFDHRYYGTAMQMPMLFIEDMHDFALSTEQIFYMRHLITFSICFAGYICFYFALKKIFKDRFLALVGVMMVSLYPRFFGAQFTDIKNMIFLALNMAVLLTLVHVVEKENFPAVFIFGCTAALATNQRVMAVVYPVILLGYWLVRDITDLSEKKEGKKKIYLFGKYPAVIAIYFGVWILISPFAWLENPITAFINTLRGFSQYNWDGTMVFMGKLVSCAERPWYYLPVWLGVSLPIVYLLLFIVGHISLVYLVRKEENVWEGLIGTYRWLTCCILLFWGIIGAIIILNSNIYIGWHHVYFVVMPLAVIAVYGLKFCMECFGKKIAGGIFVLYMVSLIGWTIYNHPFQVVYFNLVGRQFGDQFDRDEQWATSSVLLDWILEHTEGLVAISGETNAHLLLPEEVKKRVVLSDEGESTFHIDIFRNVIGNESVHEGYEEVYASWVDGYKIGAVYQKVD